MEIVDGTAGATPAVLRRQWMAEAGIGDETTVRQMQELEAVVERRWSYQGTGLLHHPGHSQLTARRRRIVAERRAEIAGFRAACSPAERAQGWDSAVVDLAIALAAQAEHWEALCLQQRQAETVRLIRDWARSRGVNVASVQVLEDLDSWEAAYRDGRVPEGLAREVVRVTAAQAAAMARGY
jgi:hypothetical protein